MGYMDVSTQMIIAKNKKQKRKQPNIKEKLSLGLFPEWKAI